MVLFVAALLLAGSCFALPESDEGLHFSLKARGINKDGSTPLYKNPNAAIEDRVNDLLPRMTLEEKVAQL